MGWRRNGRGRRIGQQFEFAEQVRGRIVVRVPLAVELGGNTRIELLRVVSLYDAVRLRDHVPRPHLPHGSHGLYPLPAISVCPTEWLPDFGNPPAHTTF